MLRYAILALLSDGRSAHGYALMKAYAERSGIRLSIGNVYRELQKLIADALIEAASRPPGTDVRRVLYRITEPGREALASWLAQPAHELKHAGGDELAHRIAIISGVDPRDALALIDALRDELAEQMKAVERSQAHAGKDDGGETADPARAILLVRQARHLDIDIEALEELRAHVRRLSPPRVTLVVEGSNGREMDDPR